MKPLQSLVVLLLAVAIGVVAAQWLGADDLNRFGEVTLRYGGYDYHSNLPKVALLAVITVLVLWLLWSLIAAPFRAWGRYRRKQGRVRLIDGLQAYEHGQWQRAENCWTVRPGPGGERGGAGQCGAQRTGTRRRPRRRSTATAPGRK